MGTHRTGRVERGDTLERKACVPIIEPCQFDGARWQDLANQSSKGTAEQTMMQLTCPCIGEAGHEVFRLDDLFDWDLGILALRKVERLATPCGNKGVMLLPLRSN